MSELRADLRITDLGVQRLVSADCIQEITEVEPVILLTWIGFYFLAAKVELLVAGAVNFQ